MLVKPIMMRQVCHTFPKNLLNETLESWISCRRTGDNNRMLMFTAKC